MKNYLNVRVPYKYKQQFDKICRDKDIIMTSQDKGTRVLIMSISKYKENFFAILNNS